MVSSLMVICESLKEKIIIIAEHELKVADEIKNFLQENGFVNIKMADDGSKIYEILRSYYNNPEQVGLVIVNDKLPQCQVKEMCKSLSSVDNGSVIPFVILSEKKPSSLGNYNDGGLNYQMLSPVNYKELLIVINFQLLMKHERFLRHNQEERLINELAERKVLDAKLKYLIVHDELTGLLNRQNFERQLRLVLNRNNMLQQNGALLFIDLDRFSQVNELEGFERGDRLLIEVIAVIRKLTLTNDLFARIGSDEFCIFLDNKTTEQVRQFAEKIRNSVYESRFFIGDVCYSISVSVGVSILNTSTVVYHPSEIISRARQACNMAKENGRNMAWEYDENDSAVKQRHRDIYWVPLIKKALLEQSFFLVFQPVVYLDSGNISHYEVLIRMRGANNETITPNEFIPVAERMGLIHGIDLWVVESAIDFLAALPPNQTHICLAINLSSVAFQDESLLPTIKNKLELTWVNANRITFEITETAAIDSFVQTRKMIEQIRVLGCKFALDDFGAGFCSFNYLKTFPVDFVKIDGQFIQNLINDETDQVLVKSMTEIATRLGKKTIAEFVESPAVIRKLQEIGVNLGQGYIFGKPEIALLPTSVISMKRLLDQEIVNKFVSIIN